MYKSICPRVYGTAQMKTECLQAAQKAASRAPELPLVLKRPASSATGPSATAMNESKI